MIDMNRLNKKFKRLYAVYRAHRQRDKSNLQIGLEFLARLCPHREWAAQLMQMAMRRHGICVALDPADIRHSRETGDRAAGAGEIFTGAFFVDVDDDHLWTSYQTAFNHKVDAVIADAERICRHEFRFLGTKTFYMGEQIDWQIDPHSGYRWPKQLALHLKAIRTGPEGSDVKWPWELSRMQHLPTLGKAYKLTHNERYAREIVDQITHWLHDNPCPYGVNWLCAMDVAIRMVNLAWAYRFIRLSGLVSEDFQNRLAIAITQHAQFTLFHLEQSIREGGVTVNGNHYLANVVGLLHVGLVCPELKMAQTWRRIGLRALVEEMDRQVYPDGVDGEASIPYHRLVLELFLAGALICHTNGVELPQRFWNRLERMFEFILWVTRPDGKVPQVGDADDGRLYILSDYGNWDRRDCRYLLSIGAVLFERRDMKVWAGGFAEEAFWLLGPAGMAHFAALETDGCALDSKAFPDAGLYVMRQEDSYLLACCGNLHAAGANAHKHNDLLSFELYLRGKPFIVDPGSYLYTRDPEWRNLFRSTRYHNTVVIDAQEQNRFASDRLFEMANDACVRVQQWSSQADADALVAEHTGFDRLPDPIRHQRTFQFDKRDVTWEVTDVLRGQGHHTADWYFHFDHGIEIASVSEGQFRASIDGVTLRLVIRSDIALICSVADDWVSPSYGCKVTAKTLHIQGNFHAGCRTVFRMCIEL